MATWAAPDQWNTVMEKSFWTPLHAFCDVLFRVSGAVAYIDRHAVRALFHPALNWMFQDLLQHIQIARVQEFGFLNLSC